MLGGKFAQRPPVFVREDLDEFAPVLAPALQYALRLRAARVAGMALDHAFRDRFVGLALVPECARELRLLLRLGKQRLQRDHGGIAILGRLQEIKFICRGVGLSYSRMFGLF